MCGTNKECTGSGIRLVVSIRYQYIIAEITLLSLHVEDLLLSL